MVFRPYQEVIMDYLWRTPGHWVSSVVWERANDVLWKTGSSISRASVINFLNRMVDEGVLIYREETGKGGARRLYTPVHSKSEFKKWLANHAMTRLLEEFPAETAAVLIALGHPEHPGK